MVQGVVLQLLYSSPAFVRQRLQQPAGAELEADGDLTCCQGSSMFQVNFRGSCEECAHGAIMH